MKLNKVAQTVAPFAIAGALSCGGQTPQSEIPKKHCDVSDPNNIEFISEEPGKTVYRVCDKIFVSQTLRTVVPTQLRGIISSATRRAIILSEAAQIVVDAANDRGNDEEEKQE